MRVRFPSLLGEKELAELEATEADFDDFLRRTRDEGSGERRRYPRVRAQVRDEVLVVRDFQIASWPLLRHVEARRGSRPPIQVGLEPSSSEDAVSRIRADLGVDLHGTRVRVGVVRGHMLEISWFVPLDVEGERDLVEDAADELCERLLGSENYETWVRSNHVVSAPRRSALRAVTSERTPTTYALEEASELLRHTVRLLERERKDFASVARGSWAVLEVGDSSEDAPQAERRFVATSEPEAIKCFLEGALFSSRRFVRDGSLFLSVVVAAERVGRVERRALFEKRLAFGDGRILVGTGFGEGADYFDLVVRDEAALVVLRDALLELEGRVKVEFWDAELEHESFELGELSK